MLDLESNTNDSPTEFKPSVLVGCVEYGSTEKVYFERQISAFSKISPTILCWKNFDQSDNKMIREVPFIWETRFLRRSRDFLRYFNIHNTFGSRGREFLFIKKVVTESRPSLIYAHTGFMGLRLLPLKRFLNIPMAVHFHGLDITIKSDTYQKSLAKNLKFFDKVFICSEWMRPFFTDRGVPESAIRVLPMGAPTLSPPLALTETLNKDNAGKIIFMFVGRLVKCKGVNYVIEAFDLLTNKYSNIEYIIVGDGPELVNLKAQAELKSNNSKIHFLGSKNPTEVRALMNASDVFIHCPTDSNGGPEAFGVTISEAMAQGKPIIGSMCGGVMDQVRDGFNGFLVPQENVEAIVKAMEKMILDREGRLAMGKRSKQLLIQKFDSNQLSMKVEKELLTLMHSFSQN